ncbi:MAG: hypothetical protein J2P46_00340 [Zavarzinella sp.]|nr:hypothetical protein [Zavarzinella sp.]
MRLLLDECVPKRLRLHFPGHDARTVRQMGWSGKRNGELLGLMLANGFEVFVTVDRNMPFQQNIAASGVAVLVLVGTSNRVADLLPVIPAAQTALTALKPGDVVEVSAP